MQIKVQVCLVGHWHAVTAAGGFRGMYCMSQWARWVCTLVLRGVGSHTRAPLEGRHRSLSPGSGTAFGDGPAPLFDAQGTGSWRILTPKATAMHILHSDGTGVCIRHEEGARPRPICAPRHLKGTRVYCRPRCVAGHEDARRSTAAIAGVPYHGQSPPLPL